MDTDQGILVTAAVRDVTERLEAQAERERLKTPSRTRTAGTALQQSRRLESPGQLAGGVAHDFNNLLGVITNYAAFVAERLHRPPGEGPSEAALADIEQIQLAAQGILEPGINLIEKPFKEASLFKKMGEILHAHKTPPELERTAKLRGPARRPFGRSATMITSLGVAEALPSEASGR